MIKWLSCLYISSISGWLYAFQFCMSFVVSVICLRFDSSFCLGSSSLINFCLLWIMYLTLSKTLTILNYLCNHVSNIWNSNRFIKKLFLKNFHQRYFIILFYSLKSFLWTSFNFALAFTTASWIPKRA